MCFQFSYFSVERIAPSALTPKSISRKIPCSLFSTGIFSQLNCFVISTDGRPSRKSYPSLGGATLCGKAARSCVPKNNFLLARRSGKVRKDRKGGDWGGERSIRGATWAHLLLSTAEIWHFNFISCLYMQHTPKPNKCADDDGHGDDDNLHTRQWDQMDF